MAAISQGVHYSPGLALARLGTGLSLDCTASSPMWTPRRAARGPVGSLSAVFDQPGSDPQHNADLVLATRKERGKNCVYTLALLTLPRIANT